MSVRLKGICAKSEEDIRCQLCGSENNIQHRIGCPVSLICGKCVKIIERWAGAVKKRSDLWRQANGVDEPIKDGNKIGIRITEIEVLLAEMERVHQNMKATKETDEKLLNEFWNATQNFKPLISDMKKIVKRFGLCWMRRRGG